MCSYQQISADIYACQDIVYKSEVLFPTGEVQLQHIDRVMQNEKMPSKQFHVTSSSLDSFLTQLCSLKKLKENIKTPSPMMHEFQQKNDRFSSVTSCAEQNPAEDAESRILVTSSLAVASSTTMNDQRTADRESSSDGSHRPFGGDTDSHLSNEDSSVLTNISTSENSSCEMQQSDSSLMDSQTSKHLTSTPTAQPKRSSNLSPVSTIQRANYLIEAFDTKYSTFPKTETQSCERLPQLDLSPILQNSGPPKSVAKQESFSSTMEGMPPSPKNVTPRTAGSRSFSPRSRLSFSPDSSPRSLCSPGSDGDGSFLQARVVRTIAP
ncbi:hypothetical protein RB195_021078 [Necator americanus]|uniref:Uncharacterized protein n=1 Tax=Necator americanus TaxID=51031 RepID=A0ABR1E9E8_NECAM